MGAQDIAIPASRFGTLGLDAGIVGRIIRLILGVGLVAYVATEILVAPRPLDLAGNVGLYSAAAFATFVAMHSFLGERLFSSANPWLGTAIVHLPFFAAYVTGYAGYEFELGFGLYLGVSLIFCFFLRYGGYEAMAIPSRLFKRRYTLYCLYNLVDAVEKIAVDGRG